MQDTDKRRKVQPIAATLSNLDGLWTIAVGPRHRRMLGGPLGHRFATDGGCMVLISDQVFASAEHPWRVPPGLASDHWAEKSSSLEAGRWPHMFAKPAELMAIDHRLGARYGSTWISTLYVDLFMRMGAPIVMVSADPMGHVVVPGLGVIMPLDPDKIGDDGEAGPS